MQIQFR